MDRAARQPRRVAFPAARANRGHGRKGVRSGVFSLHMSIPSELIPFLFRKRGYGINHRAMQQIKEKANKLNTPGLPPIKCNLETTDFTDSTDKG